MVTKTAAAALLFASVIVCANGVAGFARLVQNDGGLQRPRQPVVLASTVYDVGQGSRSKAWREVTVAPAR